MLCVAYTLAAIICLICLKYVIKSSLEWHKKTRDQRGFSKSSELIIVPLFQLRLKQSQRQRLRLNQQLS